MTAKATQKSFGLLILSDSECKGPGDRAVSKEELPNLGDILLASWCCLILRALSSLAALGAALVVSTAAAAPLEGAGSKLWWNKLLLSFEIAQAQRVWFPPARFSRIEAPKSMGHGFWSLGSLNSAQQRCRGRNTAPVGLEVRAS